MHQIYSQSIILSIKYISIYMAYPQRNLLQQPIVSSIQEQALETPYYAVLEYELSNVLCFTIYSPIFAGKGYDHFIEKGLAQ